MTYGEVKRAALLLINQYSIAGREIAASYNNQEDYIRMIPALVDAAMMEIATTVKPIPATKEVRWNHGHFRIPSDCWRLLAGHEKLPGGKVRIHYFRYPRPLGEDPPDRKRLDNSPDTHRAIPYYVASRLVLDDDAYKQQVLFNEWRQKLSELKLPIYITKEVVHNGWQADFPEYRGD